VGAGRTGLALSSSPLGAADLGVELSLLGAAVGEGGSLNAAVGVFDGRTSDGSAYGLLSGALLGAVVGSASLLATGFGRATTRGAAGRGVTRGSAGALARGALACVADVDGTGAGGGATSALGGAIGSTRGAAVVTIGCAAGAGGLAGRADECANQSVSSEASNAEPMLAITVTRFDVACTARKSAANTTLRSPHMPAPRAGSSCPSPEVVGASELGACTLAAPRSDSGRRLCSGSDCGSSDSRGLGSDCGSSDSRGLGSGGGSVRFGSGRVRGAGRAKTGGGALGGPWCKR
jgi:hypothetical protein